jgi:hypothetical protein
MLSLWALVPCNCWLIRVDECGEDEFDCDFAGAFWCWFLRDRGVPGGAFCNRFVWRCREDDAVGIAGVGSSDGALKEHHNDLCGPGE